ncbi:helix-turn-helix transcriptional regulator [Actinoplanes sp. NPDC026619]|uniref:helix-turn-helix domain-containing protein n=1 Tax=Actinoplanes sp. NPDC026619 TaxID=3155798 RepID=UPI0033D86C79
MVLARWRRRKGLTGQALGDLVGMSQAKISRLENGVVAADPVDVKLLAEALGMPAGDVERVVALAESADNRLTDWNSIQPGLADRQKQTGKIEEQATEIRVFQPAVVPGLAQTSEYARAILSALKDELDDSEIADSPAAVSEAVSERMRRAEILSQPGRTFHFLLTEQVLRNRVCEPAAMVAQIARLRELAAYPNIQLRIIADDAELPVAPYHGFYVADDRWVSADLFDSSVISKGRKIIHSFRRVFDALEGVAVTDVSDLLNRYQTHYVRMLLSNSQAS